MIHEYVYEHTFNYSQLAQWHVTYIKQEDWTFKDYVIFFIKSYIGMTVTPMWHQIQDNASQMSFSLKLDMKKGHLNDAYE